MCENKNPPIKFDLYPRCRLGDFHQPPRETESHSYAPGRGQSARQSPLDRGGAAVVDRNQGAVVVQYARATYVILDRGGIVHAAEVCLLGDEIPVHNSVGEDLVDEENLPRRSTVTRRQPRIRPTS
jgi:hypothetical protein